MKHGLGEFKSYVKRRIYKGYFLNDYYHGEGKLKYPDGKVYEGEFKKGIRHGRGTCYYRVEAMTSLEPAGSKADPRKVAKREQLGSTGVEVYKGHWKKGKKHGEGVYEWGNGRVYRGQWKNGERNGYGVSKYESGARYEGFWHRGKKHGSGLLVFADGNQY